MCNSVQVFMVVTLTETIKPDKLPLILCLFSGSEYNTPFRYKTHRLKINYQIRIVTCFTLSPGRALQLSAQSGGLS